MDTFIFVVLMAAGIFEIIKGVFRAGFGSRRTMRMAGRIGEKGARLIYIVTGFALVVIAFVIYF